MRSWSVGYVWRYPTGLAYANNRKNPAKQRSRTRASASVRRAIALAADRSVARVVVMQEDLLERRRAARQADDVVLRERSEQLVRSPCDLEAECIRRRKIGRASCREGVEVLSGAGVVRYKE